ncbi:MAG: MerC domain-containing protein [Betaproteobacteria bacterium]|nr:MerC domain-containing protein [Betaproteobacteria bacterium]
MNAQHRHNGWWDKLGITASLLCLVHCLALPVLIPLLPMLALMGHTEVHGLFLIPIISLTGLGILPGFLRHRSRPMLAAAAVGVSLCSAAVGAEALFGLHALDTPLTIAGGLSLISAHLINLRLSRAQACACPTN